MTEISAFEAKTHFSKLLKRAKNGEEITITLHGEPVAKLTPIGPKHDVEAAMKAFDEFLELGDGLSLSGLRIKDLINEGRDRHDWIIDKLPIIKEKK